MSDEEVYINSCVDQVARVYQYTRYNDDDAEGIYQKIKLDIPNCLETPEGKHIHRKYMALSGAVVSEATYQDMVKILWRMVKPTFGTPDQKLCLLLVGLGTLNHRVRSSRNAKQCESWIEGVECWLGKQLTIGGKGITGEGEGTVHDRIQRFFTTPYLHDFD